MDEEVQIMGDSQDKIPEDVYKSLVEEWAEEIKSYDAERFLRIEVPLSRKEIMETAKGLGGDPMRLIVAVEALRGAIEGKGIEKDLLPDDVSRRHIHDKPEETKSAVQQIARKALTRIPSKSPEGRGR